MAKTTPSDTGSTGDELDNVPVGPKGHATPTRKEREAARKRPLVAGNSPAQRAASRAQQQTARDRARIGLANGEERYLPAKDRGPQKRYVRDYVDARWSLGELMIPLVVVLLFATFLGTAVQVVVTLALYAFFALVIVDCVFLGIRLRRTLAEKYGADRVEAVRWYAAMRAIQLRVLRLPKPQVKRGAFPS